MPTLKQLCNLIARVNTMCNIRQDECTFPCARCSMSENGCLREKLIEAISGGNEEAITIYERMEETING